MNGESIKGIHHVSDAVLFEPTCNEEERRDMKENERTRLGYAHDDKVHTHYQVLNGVSGFSVYYYSFNRQTGLQSLVNINREK